MVGGAKWKPSEGDRVLVPWGLDRVHGTVLRIYGPPGRPTALVAVDLEGAEGNAIGEHTVSFPLAHLEPEESGATT